MFKELKNGIEFFSWSRGFLSYDQNSQNVVWINNLGTALRI